MLFQVLDQIVSSKMGTTAAEAKGDSASNEKQSVSSKMGTTAAEAKGDSASNEKQ
jgi:hypothetical protein